jgi:cyclic pyranopterin monophosphate synthase
MTRSSLSHVDGKSHPRMVDLSGKRSTRRMARAEAFVRLGPTLARVLADSGQIAKGNVIETARIAGIMAAKRTAELIPLCHPLALDYVGVDMQVAADGVRITSRVRCEGRTGVEMEAMTAAAVAALTVYDMCKSAGKGIVIEHIRLLSKTGGKSGDWKADKPFSASET